MVASIFSYSCTSSFGPGYVIDKQEIKVRFDPGVAPQSQPRISIEATYHLTNNGTQPLSILELRLPGKRQFKSDNTTLSWDGQTLAAGKSSENPRNAILNLPSAWAVSGRHTLHVVMELRTPEEEESFLGFAPDAFFLPAQSWSVELLPARGIFASGGVPPLKWNLSVQVPQGFLIHMSGDKIKTSKHGNEMMVRARQRAVDVYPYVVAGKYLNKEIGAEKRKIYLWTRSPQDAGNVRELSEKLIKTLQTYDAVFGERLDASDKKREIPTWLVECPVQQRCFTDRTFVGRSSPTVKLLGYDEGPKSGEMVSLNTAIVDVNAGLSKTISAAAPALAASWLGYAQSPGFYEQDAPLSAFPLFAAAVGRDALQGPTARAETIRRALATIPQSQPAQDDTNVLRAKSFLFFYGLQDRYGPEIFRDAVHHMLYARRSGGFGLDDLIAAFDQESHGNTAEFVRLWMKHPGVPQDFRAKYENVSADKNVVSKESTP